MVGDKMQLIYVGVFWVTCLMEFYQPYQWRKNIQKVEIKIMAGTVIEKIPRECQ